MIGSQRVVCRDACGGGHDTPYTGIHESEYNFNSMRRVLVGNALQLPDSVSFPLSPRFPLDYFAPLHPGSGIGLTSSPPAVLGVMRNTVEGINRLNGWVPESGMQVRGV